jgi:hypothetical protein
VFSKLPERLKDTGADIVFDGKNDLVVDTPSMANFEDALSLPSAQILDYGTTDKVHHMSYFRQRQTLEFIMEKLREPGG